MCRVTTILYILLMFVTSSDVTLAAGIYKWVDKDGVVQYGEQPPDDNAREIHIRSAGHVDEATDKVQTDTVEDEKARRDRMGKALEGDRLARQEKRQKQQQQQQQRKMQCAESKDNLRRYMQSSGLYKLDSKGNRVMLDEGARQQEIARMQANIKKLCD